LQPGVLLQDPLPVDMHNVFKHHWQRSTAQSFTRQA
jgi:hypothetical protein